MNNEVKIDEFIFRVSSNSTALNPLFDVQLSESDGIKQSLVVYHSGKLFLKNPWTELPYDIQYLSKLYSEANNSEYILNVGAIGAIEPEYAVVYQYQSYEVS